MNMHFVIFEVNDKKGNGLADICGTIKSNSSPTW
jgi:hypothetical protein